MVVHDAPSLVGARVLVVGAGDIGRTIGRMLAGFDVELTYVARTARDGVRSTAELPELLPHADVVILIVPVTPETTGMVDAAFLAAMPDGALLVNAARGVVVDTDALLAELTAGRLRAALDVTDPEPLPEGHPLWSAPGLLLTPHVGGAVPDTNERAAAAVTDQLARILAGRAAGERGRPLLIGRRGGEARGSARRRARPAGAGRGPRITGTPHLGAARSSPATGRRAAPPGCPPARPTGTRRCPASERTVSPSSPMSTPARSTQTPGPGGPAAARGVQGAAKASGTAHSASSADRDQRGPAHAQAGGGVHEAPCSHPCPIGPGDRGLASSLVTTVEDQPPAPRPTAR